MTLSSLTDSVLDSLKGDSKLAVYRDFDEISFNDTGRMFVTAGISGIETTKSFFGAEAQALCHGCTVRFRVSVFGKESRGSTLLSLGETLMGRILACGLNVASVSGGEVSFNTKLNRTQVEFSFTLNGRLENGEIDCARVLRTASIGGLSFLADSFSFQRERAVRETQTLGDGIFFSDGGAKALRLVLKGAFPAQKSDVVSILDGAVTGELPNLLTLDGAELSSLILTKYRFFGEKDAPFTLCELEFSGAEVMGGG